MSQSAVADLESELGIPLDATLAIGVSQQTPKPVQLLLIPPQDISSDFITIASPSSSLPDDQTYPGSFSTHVSSESSLRKKMARCLIVGRQASAADIRIDHKSVSRRHTALYYKRKQGGDEAAAVVLVVRDLGGKHGTHVNDSRIEKNGAVELPLDGTMKEHRIRFGNAPLICRVVMPPIKKVNEASLELQKLNVGGEREKNQEQEPQQALQSISEQEKGDASLKESQNAPVEETSTETTNDVPSTRESREAQIAAIVASLDSAPVYNKYIPKEDEDVDGIRNSNTTNDNNNNNDMNNLHKDTKNNNHKNKYNLPITKSITLSPGSNSFTSSDGTNTPLQANASVSTLCFEPSGARLVAGHRDGTLRFYDFHGMKPSDKSSSYPPFRIVDSDNDPLDQTGRHVITALGPSGTGSSWIVGTTSSQPKVLDREGRTTLFYFLKGDSYVTDAAKTKGHTAGVTGVAFHPFIKETCWTCGLDGSIRQWDVSGRGKTEFNKLVCQKMIGKCKNRKGQRTQVVSNLSVHPNGRKVVVGTACGSIQIWNCFGVGVNASRPLGAVYDAHNDGGTATRPVTYVAFSGDGERIASRSEGDDTVRIWDVHRIEKEFGSSSFGRKHGARGGGGGKGPQHPPSLLLAICKGLPAFNETANCAFSPDGRMVCAGTSIDPRAKRSAGGGVSGGGEDSFGKIKFYELPPSEEKRSKAAGSKKPKNRVTAVLEPVEEMIISRNSSVLGVQWHPKLNQIAVGTSNGIIQVLYDPSLSTKGALLPASRTVRQSDGLSDLLRSRAPTGSAAYLSSANSNIIVPNALPLFREEPRATRKTKERERKDPEKTRLPEPPVTGGIKTGGKMGGGVNFTQYIVESTNYVNNKNIAGKDPREELFKYSEGKNYVSRAYEGDVQRILAEKTVEEEEADLKSRKRQKTK